MMTDRRPNSLKPVDHSKSESDRRPTSMDAILLDRSEWLRVRSLVYQFTTVPLANKRLKVNTQSSIYLHQSPRLSQMAIRPRTLLLRSRRCEQFENSRLSLTPDSTHSSLCPPISAKEKCLSRHRAYSKIHLNLVCR